MKSHQKSNIMIWAFLAVILFFWVFNWIQKNGNYFFQKLPNKIESFTGNEYLDSGSPDTTHSVDLPINNTLDCSNMCSPLARCYKTGQQCSSDIDCPGCNPFKSSTSISTSSVRGNNDAGILTNGVTPRYSSLTTDIGTQAKLYTSNKLNKPAMPNFGVNTWITGYNNSMEEFNKRYRPYGLRFMPNYKNRYTLTGQFMDNGPLPSNAYI